MKHLLILSPILLVACVQHQDPCVTQRINCNPAIEDCTCGQDNRKDSYGVDTNPNIGTSVGGNSGNGNGSSSEDDDTNGDVSSDKSSDKNKDRLGKSDKSSDSNGGNSDD